MSFWRRLTGGRAAPFWLLAAAVCARWFDLRYHYLETEDFIRLFPSSPGAFPATVFRPAHAAFCWICRAGLGASPAAVQWVKLLLLWGCAAGVWSVGRRLKLSPRWAFFAALLFLCLPLHGGVMLNLLHVDDLLLTAFGLGAFRAFLRFRESRRPAWAVLCCAGLLGALLSKETAVVLPLLFAGYDLPGGRSRSAWRGWAVRQLPLLLTLAAYAGIAAHFGGGRYGGWVFLPEGSLSAPVLRLLGYLPLLADPFLGPAPGPAPVLAAAAAAAVLTAVFPGTAREKAFAAAWLLLPLLPVSGIVTTERMRGYLMSLPHPSWHLVLSGAAAAWLAAGALQRLEARTGRRLVLAAGGLLLAAAAAASARHALSRRAEFANEVVDRAFLEEGYRFSGGRFDSVMMSLPIIRKEAPEVFGGVRAAVQGAAPGRGPWITDLFEDESIYEDVEKPYRLLEALSHKGFSRFHRQLAADPGGFAEKVVRAARLKDEGVASFRSGDEAGALSALGESLRLNPENLSSKISLAAVLAKSGRAKEALAQYDALIALAPEDDVFRRDALLARAGLLARMGRASDAARDREAARRLEESSRDWRLRSSSR